MKDLKYIYCFIDKYFCWSKPYRDFFNNRREFEGDTNNCYAGRHVGSWAWILANYRVRGQQNVRLKILLTSFETDVNRWHMQWRYLTFLFDILSCQGLNLNSAPVFAESFSIRAELPGYFSFFDAPNSLEKIR